MRHITSIADLSDDEIVGVLDAAESLRSQFVARGGRTEVLRGFLDKRPLEPFIAATLFYEPSTRTRLSFETAMLRAGGRTITVADQASSSAAKGETLADAMRIVSSYADVCILRHPADGAARLAASVSSIPVINAGDGSHEHPTQTLCDLYTLWATGFRRGATKVKKEHFRGKHVAIWGDLRNGRTVHSLMYALLRFGACVTTRSSPDLDLPHELRARLSLEYGVERFPVQSTDPGSHTLDALYAEGKGSRAGGDSPSVRPPVSAYDAMYVTRLQKERLQGTGSDAAYGTVTPETLKQPLFANSVVLHPLPRVSELSYDLDALEQAKYFQQAAYGVPVRLALLVSVLTDWLKGETTRSYGGRATLRGAISDTSVACTNTRCISQLEPHSTPPRFDVLELPSTGRLVGRCFYCDTDVRHEVANDGSFSFDTAAKASG